MLCIALTACDRPQAGRTTSAEVVTIDLSTGPVARFSPDQAFGAVIDGLGKGRIDEVYSPGNITAIKRAGFGATAYNLRTELGIEAWHWTSDGSWSDALHHQGYWIGNDHPARPIITAWGYNLPRRGDSVDQANNEGYSRLDDGDSTSFWKSNPYLDPLYSRWPGGDQWITADFGDDKPIAAIRIAWALPYARRYAVQYWRGEDETDPHGRWIDFPYGKITDGHGATSVQHLSDQPITAQYVRVLLQQSAHVAAAGSRDRRDAMGYAVREIGLGTIDAHGHFNDAIIHARNGTRQTTIYVSSTDPWHRPVDRDPETEQPGFDRVVTTGLTSRLPVLLNVGALYDTPENTAAEIRFFRKRHYPINAVEIGIEPDGQNVGAADFAALFLQTAEAIRQVDPHVRLAGPGLQDAVSNTWLVEGPVQSWAKLFIAALRKAGRLNELGEFTFEHYPFDVPCEPADAMLRSANGKLTAAMAGMTRDGVPRNIPRSMLEYGLSAFSGRIAMEVPEALFNADMLAQFLTQGGHASYYLGYGPEELFDPENACAGYGELMLFGQDARGHATWPTPSFWGAQLMTRQWAQPGNGEHLLYTAKWQAKPGTPDWIVAYPLRRPDHQLAMLLINRDPAYSHTVDLQARLRVGEAPAMLHGPFKVFQYGAAQYHWQPAGSAGHPTRNEPPHQFTADGPIALPAFSMTIVRMREPVNHS